MDNPILIEVMRGGVLESFHRGSVCAVNAKGEIIFSLGDPMQLCYPRSAMKFVQALPLVELGGIERFGLTTEEIAVTCGSHNGEADHLRVVRSILKKAGLEEHHLGCGAQYPTAKKDADALIKNSQSPGAIHNNCSGKHAGMLALCRLLNYPVEDYLNPEHPVQRLILTYVERIYEYPAEKMVCALDGCTAPIYSIPVYHQALCFRNLSDPDRFEPATAKAIRIITEAVSTYPFMVAGTKRYCTEMMQVTAPEVIGKTGAEGVFCMSFMNEKIGVCIKIDDGKMQPQYNVAQALLEASGKFTAEQMSTLHSYATSPLYNFNKLETGEITVKQQLFAPFSECFH